MPELAFVGAISALLALTWVEQFTPGFSPGGEASLHHPGSDSRLLRIHLEEPLFWRAAAIDGEPNQLTGAVLRRAFRFMNAFEKQPKLLASPINSLIRRATVGGGLHHDLFELLTGELLARGKVRYVARAMGSMWGSSILGRDEEHENPTISDRVGTLAVPLFERMHDRIMKAGQAAGAVAEELTNARDFQLASQ